MRVFSFDDARSIRFSLLAVVLCVVCSRGAGEPIETGGRVLKERAALAAQGLQAWYNPTSGLYDTTGWWNSANAITTLADYSRSTGDKAYISIFPTTFKAAQKTSPGFLNNFYDDEGWWALAWVDVYDLTREPRYLAMAEAIFRDMAAGWDGRCSGGIWWSKDRKYKNAIANELFLSVAAHLASRAEERDARRRYRDWAAREWAWFSHSKMIDVDAQVNDGLDERCANNHKTKWTYNQGVVLGGLAALSQVDHDPTLLEEAKKIARATLASPSLVDNQKILHEPCEPECGGDGTQFKGIFMRNLTELQQSRPIPGVPEFVRANAGSLWSQAKAPGYRISVNWSKPVGSPDASTQSSALDGLVAAAVLTK